MYWPIGAPRLYAANKLQLGRLVDDDNDDSTTITTTTSTSTSSTTSTNTAAKSAESPIVSKNPGKQNTRIHKPKRSVFLKESVLDYNQDARVGDEIIAAKLSRSGHLFITITPSTLSIWQTKPTSVVATVLRSASSIKSYGVNVNLLLRPDSAVVVVQTELGYLITYSLATDPNSRLLYPILPAHTGHMRRRSVSGRTNAHRDPFSGPGEGHGIREVSIKFRMVIKVDAGICDALALDDELVVTTEKPPALQCVRWKPDESGTQATTTLLKSMAWIGKKSHVVHMLYDRPMDILTWVTNDGKCYAVQKSTSKDTKFTGHCFHNPENSGQNAIKSAIDARFSVIAVACANSEVFVYTAKDYAGQIPLSHVLKAPISQNTVGPITCITCSPDGYAIFVGYTNGWAIWSVYGKLGATSFVVNRDLCQSNDERWLLGVKDAFWIGGGSQIVMLPPKDNRLWVLDLARSAVTGCFSSANVARSLLQTDSGFMIYKGYDLPDLGAISVETGLWHYVHIPAEYLNRQWPIRCSVISTDGRYVAVAGRRGLAHYSVTSGRWKRFEDPYMEDEFAVRGGMCWHQHVLIAAVESSEGFQIRVYSREAALDGNTIMHTQNINTPIVHLAPSGNDSLLVYTYENHLYHFIITASNASIRLVLVGQIALSGIIRAPPRVRALTWILPVDQLEHGDPSQDIGLATILFLVDGKLVVLQPSTKENGELKYDMRIIAQNVEYYALMRDQHNFNSLDQTSKTANEMGISRFHQNDLKDSIWYFDGKDVRVWTDTQELLASTPPDLGRELPDPVVLSMDFYPLSILLSKGIVFGIEPDFIQRNVNSFVILKFGTRTCLFVPQILKHHLAAFNAPSALYLAHTYSNLTYFAHSLELLLHEILDAEVDANQGDQSLLPSVVALLQNFPCHLDVIVQCTRKTEVRSWKTLFDHLPPPRELFSQSLKLDKLSTAAGYLLVLHNLDNGENNSDIGGDSKNNNNQNNNNDAKNHHHHQAQTYAEEDVIGEEGAAVELLRRATERGEWELCKELARFLMAMDEHGGLLRGALEKVGMQVGLVKENDGEEDDDDDEDDEDNDDDNNNNNNNKDNRNELKKNDTAINAKSSSTNGSGIE